MQSYKKNRNFANFFHISMIISDFHTTLSPLLDSVPTEQIFLLADVNTAQYCLPILLQQYAKLQHSAQLILPIGEENKSIHSVENVWNFMFSHHATRRAILINVGGGVITDLGGFAAATYMRGIRFINIPTTLLAMVDASTGGKTGINFYGVKNGIGTFTQPLATCIYPPFLSTLPPTDILSGFAEMLKHGLIASAEHYHNLLQTLESFSERTSGIDFSEIIEQSLSIKKNIVLADFNEQGLRRVLNFGHTIGHAIEEAYAAQSKPVAHGYCVMWGMIAELYLSVLKLGCPKALITQMSQLMIEHYGRPSCNCHQRQQLIDWMLHDKKNILTNESAEPLISFTLLHDIAQPAIDQFISQTNINEALEYLFSL